MEAIDPAGRLEEKVAGVCLIAAPLLMIPNTFFEYRAGTLFWAGFTGVLAYIGFVPALLGIARLLRGRAPRLSVFGGLLATAGAVGGAIFSAALLFEWAEREAGTPAATMAAITEVVEGRLFPALLLFGSLFPLALLLLAVGLFRTGVVPRWVALLLGIGAVAFPAGHAGESQLITHLAEFVLLVPMAWLGLRLLGDAEPARMEVLSTA